MDQELLSEQLKQIEQHIRLLAGNSSWIPLEPPDREIRSELEYLETLELGSPGKPRQIRKQIERTPTPSDRYRSVAAESGIPEKTAKPRPAEDIDLEPLHANNLDSLKFRLRDCQRCALCENRNSVVFGQGNQKARIVFIGEGPGEDEDRTGKAFVGKAGKLLTQMIHSIGLNREAVYICNVVKCRPPGNRNPNPDEIQTCSPFLFKQLEFIQPDLIVTLGNIATKALIPGALGIMKMRGKCVDFNGTPLLPTFHPSYLLRNNNAVEHVWNDMRQIRQIIHRQGVNDQEESHPQEGPAP